ncbi:MAG: glycosyltransferase [Nitrospirae bacterium]|nr:glycosyltransferase [Nitrospirota bacterium]
MKIPFWLALMILLHTWAGYVFLLIFLSKIRRNASCKKEFSPSVTVVLTVHNEEGIIEKRLKNLLELQYPEHLLEILVVSDGSTDRTDEIVLTAASRNKRIKLFKTEGGGKSYSQNKVIPLVNSEVIVLTDADTIFDTDAVKNIGQNFADERVGCVSGRLILMSSEDSIAESQGFYWRYETLLRGLESGLGLLHTASGQIMAFRKNLFRPFKSRYGDDCIIPLDIISQGYRVVHDDKAVAYDIFPSTAHGELNARIRMTLRNITCTLSRYELLNFVKFPLLSVAILSHKICRWLTPYFMIAFLILNIFLFKQAYFYKITLYCQLLFYFLGIIGFIAEKNKLRLPVASQIFSFLLANTGFLIGVLKAVAGRNVYSYKNIKGCGSV